MKNSLLKNGFYNAVAGGIRIALAILTVPVLIRQLGVEEYGLWTLASSVVLMLGLAEAGLATTTTVFVSQDLGNKNFDGLSQTLTITFGAMLVLATLAMFALFFVAKPIVDLFPKLQEVQQYTAIQALQIGGFVVWIKLLQQILIGVEQAYQCYAKLSILNTTQSVLFSLGMFIVAWHGGRTVELMQWQAIASFVVFSSHVWVVRMLIRGINLCPAWNLKKGITIARYSLMSWLTSLGGALFSRVDRLIVGSLLGTEILGVYAVITNTTGVINSFSALPVQPLVPALNIHINQQVVNNSQLKQKVKQAFEINAAVALGFGISLFILAPFVMHLLVDSVSNHENILAFRLATLIYSLYSLNAVGFYILLSLDVKLCMIIQIFSAIFSLLLISITSYYFGLLGVVIGNIGFLFSLLFIYFGMKKICLPLKLWVRWLKFPLLWLVYSTLITCLIAITNSFIVAIVYNFIVVLILANWFIRKQNINLKKIIYNK